jgi:plasmid stability protein
MATLTIKNLPDEIYATLSKTAKRNRRSINGEAIVRLEQGLLAVEPNLEMTIARIRRNREAMKEKGIWLTDEMLDQAKNEGRP